MSAPRILRTRCGVPINNNQPVQNSKRGMEADLRCSPSRLTQTIHNLQLGLPSLAEIGTSISRERGSNEVVIVLYSKESY
jgi:hypothetical protein